MPSVVRKQYTLRCIMPVLKEPKPVFQKELGSFCKDGDIICGFVDLYPSGIIRNNGYFHVLSPFSGDSHCTVLHIALRSFPCFSVIQPTFLFSQLVKMAIVQQKLNSLLNLLATLLGEEIQSLYLLHLVSDCKGNNITVYDPMGDPVHS